MFLRLDTNKAEIVATVLFVEKELNKKGEITEQDVLNEVMKWKQKRKPPLNDKDKKLSHHVECSRRREAISKEELAVDIL